ncbi:hypothetical protein ACETU7_12320 [Rhodococcus sp. 3Y1]
MEVDRSDGGFRLYVNGIRVYCRGSVWVPTDPISLQGDAGTTRVLERLAEAGLNMIRIPGTMVYEATTSGRNARDWAFSCGRT